MKRSDERSLYKWAFVLRFALALLVWILAVTGVLTLMEDAMYYELAGAYVAQDWLAGRESLWLKTAMTQDGKAWLLSLMIAVVYFLLGGVRAVPVLVLLYSLLMALTPVLTYRIALRLGASRRAARIAGFLVVASPIFAFWAALYKEGLILLVLNLFAYHALVLLDRWDWRSIGWLVLAVAALLGLRFYLALLILFAFGMSLLLARPAERKIGAGIVAGVRQAMVVAVFAAAVLIAGLGDDIGRALPASTDAAFQTMDHVRGGLAGARSGYLPDADVSTLGKAVAFAPLGAAYFLSVPLPWHVGSIRQNLVIPETALWLLLYPLIAVGAIRMLGRNLRGTALILAFTLALSLLFGLFVGNIGTAYRMRSQVWLLWAVFAGVGIDWWQKRRDSPDHLGAHETHTGANPVEPGRRAAPRIPGPVRADLSA